MPLREASSLVGVERCVGLVIMPTSSSGNNFCFLRKAGPLPRDVEGVDARFRLRWRLRVCIPLRRGEARLWIRRRLRVCIPSKRAGVGGGVDGHAGGARSW